MHRRVVLDPRTKRWEAALYVLRDRPSDGKLMPTLTPVGTTLLTEGQVRWLFFGANNDILSEWSVRTCDLVWKGRRRVTVAAVLSPMTTLCYITPSRTRQFNTPRCSQFLFGLRQVSLEHLYTRAN